MVSTAEEERFMEACNILKGIIIKNIEQFEKLMRENKSFKSDYNNTIKQLKILEKLIKTRKSTYSYEHMSILQRLKL